MNEDLKSFNLKQLINVIKTSPSEKTIKSGDNFCFLDVRGRCDQVLRYPCRVQAYSLVLCLEGSIDVEINLNRYTLRQNMLIMNLPENIFRVRGHEGEDASGEIHFMMLSLSKDYLLGLNLEFKLIIEDFLRLMADPIVILDNEDREFILKYFSLISDVIGLGLTTEAKVVSGLVSSFFYFMQGAISLNAQPVEVPADTTFVRLQTLFRKFMNLVSDYHSSERSISFYAGQLGMTPKYLSKLIKQVSGRSASDWIDSFVILEAKNLLIYSGNSIKEIVYKLNFPNPSVFYKYFKAHTGMTPSEYRAGSHS